MLESQSSRYPAPGEIIDGKYRIDRVLGEGGMGAVMAAYHMMLRAPVALKFISPDMLRVPGAVERFLNEGVAARNIHSDHVVRIDDVGRLPTGLPFIVMEMLSGCDLAELLDREGRRGLPVPRAAHFVLQILRGLHVAHSAGVIHRDLKPSNAFVITREGEPDFVKLLDFGISKITQEREGAQQLTQTNTGLGTPLYMSPEQARNARDATPRSDLYSLSAILYELLTGRTPYVAETPNDLLYKLFTAEPDPIKQVRPDLPDGLCALVHAGLSKDPSLRPGSAVEYAELLSPYADERSAALLARIRAAAGPATVRGTPSLSEIPRPSSAPLALERTVAATEVAAQTAASPGKIASTQLNMGVGDSSTPGASESPPKGGAGKLLVAVAAAALLAVGGTAAFMASRSSGGALAEPSPTTHASSAEAPPSAPAAATSAAAPTVVPIILSATPDASSAPPAGPSASAKVLPRGSGSSQPTRPVKTNPFNVGIVQ